jgi:hypothetical protein
MNHQGKREQAIAQMVRLMAKRVMSEASGIGDKLSAIQRKFDLDDDPPKQCIAVEFDLFELAHLATTAKNNAGEIINRHQTEFGISPDGFTDTEIDLINMNLLLANRLDGMLSKLCDEILAEGGDGDG